MLGSSNSRNKQLELFAWTTLFIKLIPFSHIVIYLLVCYNLHHQDQDN